jgi:hypothetical protein
MSARLRLSTAIFVLVVAPKARAQASASEQAGFQALILTPIAALPQRVPSAGETPRQLTAELVYGRYRFEGNSRLFHNLGLGARFRVLHRLSIGATVGSRSCEGCEGLKMAGGELQADLWRRDADEPGEGSTYLALRLSAGIGQPNRAHFNARSIAGSVPLAVTLPQAEGSALTLFFSPAFAYGYINDGGGTILGRSGGDGATRFIVAAGVGYEFPTGLGAHAVVHRVVIEDSPTLMGFAISWSFGKRRR